MKETIISKLLRPFSIFTLCLLEKTLTKGHKVFRFYPILTTVIV